LKTIPWPVDLVLTSMQLAFVSFLLQEHNLHSVIHNEICNGKKLFAGQNQNLKPTKLV